MPTTFTIRKVPDEVADALRLRAITNRRSLQRELLMLVENAVQWADVPAIAAVARAREPARPGYAAAEPARKNTACVGNPAKNTARKLTLEQLWQRARKLGTAMPDESTAIVRRDRDARQGR